MLVASCHSVSQACPRVIFLSSFSVYGDGSDEPGPVTEETPTSNSEEPSSRYYQQAEQQVLGAGEGCVLRFPDMYSAPGDLSFEQRVAMCHEYFGGKAIFSADAPLYAIHFEDVVNAVFHALDNDLEGIFDVCDNDNLPATNKQVFDAICQAADMSGNATGLPCDVARAHVEAMVRTNMMGTINGCRVAARGMIAKGSGKLFNVLGGGSDGEYFPGFGIYGSTKRGLNYFTDALVKELNDTPLIAGKIRPGMIITAAVIRESQVVREKFDKSRMTVNNLVDTVETVIPLLADRILAPTKAAPRFAGSLVARLPGVCCWAVYAGAPTKLKPLGFNQ